MNNKPEFVKKNNIVRRSFSLPYMQHRIQGYIPSK